MYNEEWFYLDKRDDDLEMTFMNTTKPHNQHSAHWPQHRSIYNQMVDPLDAPVIEPPLTPVEDPDIEREHDQGEDPRRESPYRVLIHNDDVTPYEYVVRILQRIFLLSEELAEHVAWTAHHEEVAVVVVRPRSEAEKLVKVASAHARADGYPLAFTLERVN